MTSREPTPAKVVLPLRLLSDSGHRPAPPPRDAASEAEPTWVASLGRYQPEAAAEGRQWDRPMDLPPVPAPGGPGAGPRRWLIGAGLFLLGLAAGGILGAALALSLGDARGLPLARILPPRPVERPLPPAEQPLPTVVQDAIRATTGGPAREPDDSAGAEDFPLDAAASPPGR